MRGARWMLALLLLVAAPAQADDQAQAKARVLYQSGVERYDARDWPSARAKFEEAWRLSKQKDLLYNIAVCHREAGEFAKALEYFQSYLASAGPTALDGAKVRQQIADLEKLLPPHLTVLNRDVPAKVTVDGASRGATPVSIDVVAGAHSVQVVVGARSERQELVLAAGQRRTLEFSVSEPSPKRTALFVAIGVAVALVAVGVAAAAIGVTSQPGLHSGTLGSIDVR